MPQELCFACPLPNGLHARPASALEEVAREFASEVLLYNQRTGSAANAKSVLSIVGADIRYNDRCTLKISGSDEAAAFEKLSAFIRDTFPNCDAPLPAILSSGELILPRLLCNAGAKFFPGTIVVSGIGCGRVVRAGGFRISAELALDGASDIHAEQRKLDEALEQLIRWFDQRIDAIGRGVEMEVLAAHRSIARDMEFRRVLCDSAARGRTAAGAISDSEAHFSAILGASASALLRERALDVQDVCNQLLQRVYGEKAGAESIKLTSDSIVMAETLTPSQFLALDRSFLKGLVLTHAGTTSHTVILARSFGIPTLVGVENSFGATLDGQEVIVDADLGALVTQLTDAAHRYYALERQRLVARQGVLAQHAVRTATTRDGCRLEIAANIATADEAAPAFAAGAEGIGLFRTEMLFSDRDSAPSEDEQYEAYRAVLENAKGKPVIIRTLDIGGDKPLAYLNLPAEQNPFLGYRAVRFYPQFESLIRCQFRALIRASCHGSLKVMIPMVATLDEVRWVKKIMAEERATLGIDKGFSLGAMIEVPAAAVSISDLSRELDFFSIGSNDLLQYFMAVDRANRNVAALYNPLQPAFLRFLKQIVDAARAEKKWIGLCGEMGSQTQLLPLLIGLGLNEISASTPALAGLKCGLSQLSLPECQELLAAALRCATADEVAALLNQFAGKNRAPLVAPELIDLNVEATTKEEAIKQAVDLLYIHGRVEQPRAVEEAVWQREATYSTGFGHGFAIPHCKTNAVQTNSLAIVKLRTPVTWGSLDGQPVRVVILLAIRESDAANEHMKIFAKLARQVMHKDFRAQLENSVSNLNACDLLMERLGLSKNP